jgi:hypothetical protein
MFEPVLLNCEKEIWKVLERGFRSGSVRIAEVKIAFPSGVVTASK